MVVNGSLISQDCKYDNYFYWSNSAYFDIQDGRMDDALKKIKRSLSTVDFPLAYELEQALKISEEVGDYEFLYKVCVLLAKGGIPLEYFGKYYKYEWYDKFEQEFTEYTDYYTSHFNLEMKKELLEIRKNDSIFNSNYHKWRIGEFELSLDDLIKGATQISSRFKALVKKSGFPCERNMGYFYQENKIREYPLTVLLIHFYQRGELLYKNSLTEKVCEGKLRPQQQASISRMRGFGNSTGIEQEMRIRYKKYSHSY